MRIIGTARLTRFGEGIWNRDAYVNEGITFDSGMAHQAQAQYHYHANPVALRYQLGDHVELDAQNNRYHESTAPVTKHSPILAWARDGLADLWTHTVTPIR